VSRADNLKALGTTPYMIITWSARLAIIDNGCMNGETSRRMDGATRMPLR
jgi:hypothetical protein